MRLTTHSFLWIAAMSLIPLTSAADQDPQAEILIQAPEQSAAVLLPYGVRVEGAIGQPLDSDLFEFMAEAGDTIRIRICTDSATLDPRYELRGPTNLLVDSWSCNAGSSGCTYERQPGALEAGLHRISIQDNGLDDSGDYTIQFERISPEVIERVLGYDQLTTDVIEHKLDLDAFRVCLVAGTFVRISVTTADPNLDPRYQLYAPDRTLLDTWSCNAGSSGCTFSRDFVPPVSGTYAILLSDNGLNETGTYALQINCLSPDCPIAASAVVRNGSGVNPLLYSVACLPVLGGNLEVLIDTSFNPNASAAFLLFYAQGSAPLPTPFGEALLDRSSPLLARIIRSVAPGQTEVRVSIPIPPSPSLAGLFTTSQAALLDQPPVLTNALDLVVGY